MGVVYSYLNSLLRLVGGWMEIKKSDGEIAKDQARHSKTAVRLPPSFLSNAKSQAKSHSSRSNPKYVERKNLKFSKGRKI